MEWLDGVGDWLAERLTWLPEILVLPVLAWLAYLAARWLLVWVVPLVVERLVAPVVVAALGVLGVAGLTAEFVATQAFRVVRRRPPSMLYGAGDLAVSSMVVLQPRTRVVARTARRLGRVNGGLLLAVVILLMVWWSDGYCGRQREADCVAPGSVWWAEVGDLWRSLPF
jgi:hypothetical protein